MQKAHLIILKAIVFSVFGLGLLVVYWHLFIALKEEPISFQEILSSHNYQTPQSLDIFLTPLDNNQFGFTYTSFDGDKVNGQIRYPQAKNQATPFYSVFPPSAEVMNAGGVAHSRIAQQSPRSTRLLISPPKRAMWLLPLMPDTTAAVKIQIFQ
ncbi:hypothetical protein [Microbulbifer variabilis]|uniref:hypothetical protein n=1 Tax=Microbulbifer variabilis TaxID=266805 RepID=UPI001CFED584|nr:hypothetical protein [Microbulbifer variabilis]